MRLVAVQHLRAAYGIKTKNWNKNKAASCNVKSTANNSVSLKKTHAQHSLLAFLFAVTFFDMTICYGRPRFNVHSINLTLHTMV